MSGADPREIGVEAAGDEAGFSAVRSVWGRVAGRRFAAGDLEGLLCALEGHWLPGSFPAEMARALNVERRRRGGDGSMPEPLELSAIDGWPTTDRIDGVLPLRVPTPCDARFAADELLAEAVRLELGGGVRDREALRSELALAFLALLHRRPIATSHGMQIIPLLSCPATTLLLRGELPLGGKVTLWVSPLIGAEWCEFDPGTTAYHDTLELVRGDGGGLTIRAGTERLARRPESWTFRL